MCIYIYTCERATSSLPHWQHQFPELIWGCSQHQVDSLNQWKMKECNQVEPCLTKGCPAVTNSVFPESTTRWMAPETTQLSATTSTLRWHLGRESQRIHICDMPGKKCHIKSIGPGQIHIPLSSLMRHLVGSIALFFQPFDSLFPMSISLKGIILIM